MNAVMERRTTPDDLLRMEDGVNYELVDGELVERNIGWESSRIGGTVYGLLFSQPSVRAIVSLAPADASYRCFPDDPDKVRRPDVSAIRLERLPPVEERQGHCRVAPDLAVEVVSPHDYYEDVEVKVQEYLDAGVKLVWVISPSSHTVRVHRLDGSVSDLDEVDDLSGESVIPGFTCRVAEIFQSPQSRP